MNFEIPELSFESTYDKNDIMLFEIRDEETLEKLIDGTISLEIVSHEEDPLVICTNDKTYQLLEFDTSNSLLVHDGPQIFSKQTSTFELRHISPPFLQFREDLNKYPATEAEIYGHSEVSNPLSLDFLRENTLCSRQEFDFMLIEISAFTIGEYIKVPTPELRNLITNSIIRYSLKRSPEQWKVINIPELLENIQIPRIHGALYRDQVILAVLRSLCSDFSDEIAHLDEKKIVQHYATEILTTAYEHTLSKENFYEQMKGALPTDLIPTEEQLYGILVSHDDYYTYIDDSSLPIDINERFLALFQMQNKWHTNEIEPFFKYYIGDDTNFADLASLHARFVDDMWMPR